MNRRDFLKGLATLTGAVIVAPAILTDIPTVIAAPSPPAAIPIPSVASAIPERNWNDIFLTINGETYPMKTAELIAETGTIQLDATLYWTPQIDRLLSLAITDGNKQLDIKVTFGRERVAYQLPMRLNSCDLNATLNDLEVVLQFVGNQSQAVRH